MLLLSGAIGGCVETTEQKNERAAVQDDRLLASRSAVVVTRSDPNVTVLGVSMLRGAAGAAVAVSVRNDSRNPVSDLPINVGVKTAAGKVVYLNREAELPYFQTHIGGLGAESQATWVFSTAHRAPGGRAFARVGAGTVPLAAGVRGVPAIASSVTSKRRRGDGATLLDLQLVNRSSVGQTGLELYAYALSGDRLTAAGAASVGSLGSQAKRPAQVLLLGEPGASAVRLDIPPTNLQ
ncbi:MAG TPA: hypothetical protein VGX51_09160 [Solirubrobacteraceae bacterium]|jgi:hypothetical protein|nr:hypothetical protein [Solirubrobacteraceae bacterium]